MNRLHRVPGRSSPERPTGRRAQLEVAAVTIVEAVWDSSRPESSGWILFERESRLSGPWKCVSLRLGDTNLGPV